MSELSNKRFNWVRSPTAWQRSQAWRERQQQARESFEASNANANAKFFGATINQTEGLASIAAQIASKREQAKVLNAALNQFV
jgi:hypothetical protein